METVEKDHSLPGVWDERERERERGRDEWGRTKDLRAMKLLCVIQWWIHAITHLSTFIECITQRVNPIVNEGL